MLLEKELEGLEENRLVFRDRRTLGVAEKFAEKLKNIGLGDSEHKGREINTDNCFVQANKECLQENYLQQALDSRNR